MEQITPFKELTRKQQVQYIWDYYRIHIIVAIIAICVLISSIVHFTTRKDELLCILMVNSNLNVDSDTDLVPALDHFVEQNSYDSKKQEIAFNRNIYVNTASEMPDYSTMNMVLATQAYGVFIGDQFSFDELVRQESFIDLSTVLSEEQMKEYKDDLVDATEEETGEIYPCGIRLTKENSWLVRCGVYPEECYYGLLYQEKPSEVLQSFTEYVLHTEY